MMWAQVSGKYAGADTRASVGDANRALGQTSGKYAGADMSEKPGDESRPTEIKTGRYRWVWVLLAALTIIASVAKIITGFDCDESYIVMMGIRMLDGDLMFRDMWELHMTSAWPAYLCLAAYRGVTGSLYGAVVFLRVVSVLVQSGVALLVYRVFKRHNGKHIAAAVALTVANFLPRATQNLEYGLIEMICVITAVTLIYDVLMSGGSNGTRSHQNPSGENSLGKAPYRADVERRMSSRRMVAQIIIAGVIFAVGVLAYPTIIISFPIIVIAMYIYAPCESTTGNAASAAPAGSYRLSVGNRLRLPVIFALTCAACAVLFIAYILSYMSFADFTASLGGMLSDGMHSDAIPKTATYGRQLLGIAARSAAIIAFAAVFIDLLPAATFLSGALIFIGLNITGVRPSSPIGLQCRYIIAAAVAVYYVIKRRDSLMAWLFVLPGIAIYIGAMIGGNNGFEENASFLYLAVIAGVVAVMESAGRYATDRSDIPVSVNARDRLTGAVCSGTNGSTFTTLCIAAFLLSLIFTKGYLVRVTGTNPANICENRVRITEGLLAGVSVYPDYARTLASKESAIRKYTDESDTLLYLGTDAICNTFSDGSYTSATCISTPLFNEEWVEYYEDESHRQPTVIFVDKEASPTWQYFAESAFGEYLIERYAITDDEIIENTEFYIIEL
jgi:hypothetical protein